MSSTTGALALIPAVRTPEDMLARSPAFHQSCGAVEIVLLGLSPYYTKRQCHVSEKSTAFAGSRCG